MLLVINIVILNLIIQVVLIIICTMPIIPREGSRSSKGGVSDFSKLVQTLSHHLLLILNTTTTHHSVSTNMLLIITTTTTTTTTITNQQATTPIILVAQESANSENRSQSQILSLRSQLLSAPPKRSNWQCLFFLISPPY